MRNVTKFWFLSVLILVLFGFGVPMNAQTPPDQPPNEMDTYTISLVSPESHIQVKALKPFAIKIEGNITTGYAWYFKPNADPEKELFKFIRKKTDDELQNEPKLMGAPSFEILVFESLGFGQGVIQLEYKRPWEKDVPPIKTHKIIVTVQ
ncbi:MAG: protease inhibitor I42 family protein [Candidatus Omnitrophota bacterium]